MKIFVAIVIACCIARAVQLVRQLLWDIDPENNKGQIWL